MEKAMRPKGFLGFLGVATQDRPTLFLDLEKLKVQTNRNGQYSLL
jgi:hypothetical protein